MTRLSFVGNSDDSLIKLRCEKNPETFLGILGQVMYPIFRSIVPRIYQQRS